MAQHAGARVTGDATPDPSEATDVHAILWKYAVRPDAVDAFERAYGPAGAWAQLFGRHAGYIGTELYRDAEEPLVYVTVDRWRSAAAHADFLAAHRGAYDALDRECARLTSAETALGEFEAVDAPARS